MGDPPGSSRVSSQKQNREGVVGAQSGQYRATVVERAREVIRPGPGCDIIPTNNYSVGNRLVIQMYLVNQQSRYQVTYS